MVRAGNWGKIRSLTRMHGSLQTSWEWGSPSLPLRLRWRFKPRKVNFRRRKERQWKEWKKGRRREKRELKKKNSCPCSGLSAHVFSLTLTIAPQREGYYYSQDMQTQKGSTVVKRFAHCHLARILTPTCLAAGLGCYMGRKKVRWKGERTDVGGEMYRKTSSWVLGMEVPGVTGLEMRRIGNGVSAPPGLRGHFLSI